MEIKVGELYWDRSIKETVRIDGVEVHKIVATRLKIKGTEGWGYRFCEIIEKEELDNLILLIEDD